MIREGPQRWTFARGTGGPTQPQRILPGPCSCARGALPSCSGLRRIATMAGGQSSMARQALRGSSAGAEHRCKQRGQGLDLCPGSRLRPAAEGPGREVRVSLFATWDYIVCNFCSSTEQTTQALLACFLVHSFPRCWPTRRAVVFYHCCRDTSGDGGHHCNGTMADVAAWHSPVTVVSTNAEKWLLTIFLNGEEAATAAGTGDRG